MKMTKRTFEENGSVKVKKEGQIWAQSGQIWYTLRELEFHGI